MTKLDEVIAHAYASQGKQEDVNQVYLTLLRSSLFFPTKREMLPNDDEPFRPLYASIDGRYFMLVFDTLERLTEWAGEQFLHMGYVELLGSDLIKGIGENVFLVLNQGVPFYKEFSPDEIKHLKKIVARTDQLRDIP
ncbi:MAG: hypothetical protein ACD_60C00160G0009 [uncultured bacterium]|nr:MAG: hypothetical protein ACD_60C00160G0009 [uncultured bacterium]